MPKFNIELNEYQIDYHIDLLDKKYKGFIDSNSQWIVDLYSLFEDDCIIEVAPSDYIDACSDDELELLKKWMEDKFPRGDDSFKINSLDDQYRFDAVRTIYDKLSTEEITEFLNSKKF